MQRSSFICIHFSFIVPAEGLCRKPKYGANIIHHFISCREDQFTVLSVKFGTQYFTDPGVLKIRRTLIGLVVVVLPSQVFLLIVSLGPGSAVGKERKAGNGEEEGAEEPGHMPLLTFL